MRSLFFRLPSLLSVWFFSLLSTPQSKSSQGYVVVKRWPISKGKAGKTIAISPEAATVSGLKALGDALLKETLSDRNAYILVFTNVWAAAQGNGTFFSLAKNAFVARHFVGRYTRYAANKIHELEIFPEGIDGPSQLIQYGIE